jgi:chemotaxis protein methyltransferase CheR
MKVEPQTYAVFSAFVEELIGLRYEDSSKDLFLEKLEVAASEEGFDSLLDYYYFLRYDPGGPAAIERMIEQLVVPETYFFRELMPLEWLVRDVLLPKVQAGLRVRIWSAACSTGEEPLSLAMLLDERKMLDSVDIVASDVSARSIERARSGRFRPRSIRDGAPERLVKRYLVREDGGVTIERRLVERVHWRQVNLFDVRAITKLGIFDAILCRNVLIYFSNDGIVRVIGTLLERLVSEGVLLVGISESLFRIESEVVCEERGGVFFYRRRTQ